MLQMHANHASVCFIGRTSGSDFTVSLPFLRFTLAFKDLNTSNCFFKLILVKLC